jgi:hypothetical protein
MRSSVQFSSCSWRPLTFSHLGLDDRGSILDRDRSTKIMDTLLNYPVLSGFHSEYILPGLSAAKQH